MSASVPDVPVLHVSGLSAGYGGAPIIEDIELTCEPREVVVIVGPNGAGKSTLLKAVFGLCTLHGGAIAFEGRDIAGIKTSDLVPLGVSMVPQTQNVFPSLSVRENLEVGAYAVENGKGETGIERIVALFPDLEEKLGQSAGELSGGQRQMVALGRALMSAPRLLLLDEPTAGLSPAYLERIFDLILQIRETGVTVLMVEQNAKQALRIADRGYVLANGANAFTGTGAELLADDEVRRSFLGGGAAPSEGAAPSGGTAPG